MFSPYLVVDLDEGAPRAALEPGLARCRVDAEVAGEEVVKRRPQGHTLPLVLHQLVDGRKGLRSVYIQLKSNASE